MLHGAFAWVGFCLATAPALCGSALYANFTVYLAGCAGQVVALTVCERQRCLASAALHSCTLVPVSAASLRRLCTACPVQGEGGGEQ